MIRAIGLATIAALTSAYTDVYCSNCWYEVHENRWEMEEYRYPDYESAFWTCCFQCFGQDGDWRPGNEVGGDPANIPHVITAESNPWDPNDPANDPRGNRIPMSRRARGIYTYPPGKIRNGVSATAPRYQEDPYRTCPTEYARSFYPSSTTRPATSYARSTPSYSTYIPQYTSNTFPSSYTNNYRPSSYSYNSYGGYSSGYGGYYGGRY